MNKLIVALVAAFVLSSPAAAQHSHGNKGPNGGILEDVAGVHAELLTSGNTITINILNEDNKPLPTQGFTASVLVVAGSDRETVKLQPSGTSLKGDAKKAVAANAQITLMLKTSAGKSGQARYKK